MAVTTLYGRVCDRSDCPAPAGRQLLICGQDFSFCAHHAAELVPPPSVIAGHAVGDITPPDPPGQVARAPMLAVWSSA